MIAPFLKYGMFGDQTSLAVAFLLAFAAFFYFRDRVDESPWLNAADDGSMAALAKRIKSQNIGFLVVDNLLVVSGRPTKCRDLLQ